MSQNVVNSYRYVTETPALVTDGSSDWSAKFILQGNTVGGNGGGVWGGITANAEITESIWYSNAIGVKIGHNGGGWDGQLGTSYGGRISPIESGWIFSSGTTNPYYFLIEQVGTTVTAKAYSDDWGGTLVGTATIASFVEMTGLSYAYFGDNRPSTTHEFDGNGDTFSVEQTGNIDWSDDFTDASKWTITADEPTINDAVPNQANMQYTSGQTWTQKWARQVLTA